MIGLALGLIALALADLVSGGLSGRPTSRARSLAGIVAAVAIAIVGCWLFSLAGALWFVGFTIVGLAGWLLFRHGAEQGPAPAAAALGSLGLYLALLLVFSGEWNGQVPEALGSWLARIPFPVLAATEAERLLLILGIALALTAPSNGLVRSVLSVAGSEITSAEERLRGGRYIGILERLLVFGLAVGGELAAAALIASAKSILRFPELTRVAREDTASDPESSRAVADVDIVTEYFLLGSLVSWFAALAPVPLLLH